MSQMPELKPYSRTTRTQTICTIGYSGREPDSIFRQVRELKATMIDVRLKPYSRWAPQWNKNALYKAMSRLEYVWIEQFGNKNYRGEGPIEILDFDAGMSKLSLILPRPIVLMCCCKNHEFCHRSEVARMVATRLEASGRECEIVHLGAAGEKPVEERGQPDMFATG